MPLTRSKVRQSAGQGDLRMSTLGRRRLVSAVVIVDGERLSTPLAAKPPVGTQLDVGFPVVVVQTKDVAGGGVIIAAERVNRSPAAD